MANISMVVALGVNGELGYGNRLPWRTIPEDLTRFKQLTVGHTVIMGRRTLESIGHLLQGRHNIVLSTEVKHTRKQIKSKYPTSLHTTYDVHNDLQKAIKSVEQHQTKKLPFVPDSLFDICIIGGAQVYHKALNLDIVNTIYLTIVKQEKINADIYLETGPLSILRWHPTKVKITNTYEFWQLVRRK